MQIKCFYFFFQIFQIKILNYKMSSSKISQALLQEFSEAFSLFDSEQTGYIDARSLKALMKVCAYMAEK